METVAHMRMPLPSGMAPGVAVSSSGMDPECWGTALRGDSRMCDPTFQRGRRHM